MANKNNRKFQKNKSKENVVDVNYKEIPNTPTNWTPYQEKVEPTFEEGNYVITVVSKGETLKKIAVAGAEIHIQKLADGGLTVDLK
ncbi:hypothetical protein ELS18_13975 [Clostridium perfringens]|uniref:hypothetical protein n=1 Tax=Clostridium perfringens TaxID=1502 RepID=UPI000F8C4A8E|nr:hypothetical protein [Clostridium perfringens]RUR35130.1 hypothetical protein ELS18_13975 [Clostridium perfringens]